MIINPRVAFEIMIFVREPEVGRNQKTDVYIIHIHRKIKEKNTKIKNKIKEDSQRQNEKEIKNYKETFITLDKPTHYHINIYTHYTSLHTFEYEKVYKYIGKCNITHVILIDTKFNIRNLFLSSIL